MGLAHQLAGAGSFVENSEARSLGLAGTEQYEVVTTNFGWNTEARHNFSRRILTGEFFNATLAHERYNASAWADLEVHPDPTRRVVAFMDVDTCLELNYPFYGNAQGRYKWYRNLEPGYAPVGETATSVVYNACPYLKRAATSPALTANPDSRLVLLDCSGTDKLRLQKACNFDKRVFDSDQVIVAHMSLNKYGAREVDVGLPPPAIKPIALPAYERYQVQTCEKRKYLFSFQGKKRKGRDESGLARHLTKFSEGLWSLRKYDDIYIQFYNERDYIHELQDDIGKAADSLNYHRLMMQTTFAAAPRGDNLFSYRFAEVLSSGAVPVVYADNWLRPFNSRDERVKIIDWHKCGVFIGEHEVNKTREILLAIPDEERCRMQRCALEVWDRYISSREGWLRGLIEVALMRSAPMKN